MTWRYGTIVALTGFATLACGSADEVDEQKVQCKVAKDDQNELRVNWIESIRSREPNRSQVELGTKVMVIVDLAARSMWTGRAWSFDPEARTAQAI